jgi:hypothetical protein
MDDVQLSAVPLRDPLREDAGVFPGLGLRVSADDLGIERIRHGRRA